jgi:hypothetical protein
LLELAKIIHAGMTPEDFAKIAEDWIASARHPKFNRLYTEVIYRPMLEVLAYFACQWLQVVYRLRRGSRFYAGVGG